MSKNSLFFIAFAFVALLFTCSKPSPIGDGQLESELVGVLFTDTVKITAQSVDEDSIEVFAPGRPTPIALFGNYEDPIFGNINASVYTQIRFLNDVIGPDIDSAAVLDSVVLVLAYDSTSVYGDYEQMQSVEIYRVIETMETSATYFSNTSFNVDPTPLGSKLDFNPRPKENVEIGITGQDTTREVHPHLRVRLNDGFGRYLISLKDSADIFNDQDAFKNTLRGFHIKPVGNPTNSILAFDLLNQLNGNGLSGLWLYYHVETDTDTLSEEYRFRIDEIDVRVTNFDQDDENSIADDFANDPQLGDSLLFIQGMVGKNIEVKFPNANQLSNIAVNKAELELTVANLPGDNDMLDPSFRIFAYTMEDGVFQVIDDIAFDGNILNVGSPYDGRQRELEDDSGMMITQYRLNLAVFFQDLIRENSDQSIYLRVSEPNRAFNYTKEVIPSRTVIFGPGHSEHPMKLNLYYTKIE